MEHDAIIIGATTEGLTAALTGADIGMRVALVDNGGAFGANAELSGPFVLSLMHETLMEIRAAYRVLGREHTTRELRKQFSRIFAERRSRVVASYRSDVRRELAEKNVTVVSGNPRFRSGGEVEIDGAGTHRAAAVVIATGSTPRRPAGFNFDGEVVCDVDSVVAQDRVPSNLVVVGADMVGCEFSCMFAALGCRVTLVDRRMRLLRFVDADLREFLHTWMQNSGVTVVLGESVERVKVLGSAKEPYAQIELGSGRLEVAERVLVAAGAEPRSENMGLEQIGVERDRRGFVSIGDRFETTVTNVYAAGGVVDGLASTTMRIHQGRVAMLCAAGLESVGVSPTPMVIYTVPEIATVGLSEEACEILEIPHIVGCSGLGRSLRSKLRGDDEGLIKLVVSTENHRLLGVHVVGTAASELVGLGAALLRRDGTVEEITTIGLSPQSRSEAYYRAALDALTKLDRPSVARTHAPVDTGGRF